MRDSDRDVAAQFASKVRLRFPEAKIWLFGSRARGEASPESDMDACVLLGTKDAQKESEIQRIAWETGFDNGLVVTALCYSGDEFFHGPRTSSPLTKSILAEGIPL